MNTWKIGAASSATFQNHKRPQSKQQLNQPWESARQQMQTGVECAASEGLRTNYNKKWANNDSY